MIAASEGARESVVPEIVMAAPPGTRLYVPRLYAPAESATRVVPPSMNGSSGDGKLVGRGAGLGGIVSVNPLMMRAVAEVAREIVVPETVIAGPPGVRVCVPIWYCPEGFAVITELPIVTVGRLAGMLEAGARFCVCPLIMMIELPREIVVPALVITGPPTASVCVPTKYNPAALGLMIVLHIVKSSSGESAIDCDSTTTGRVWVDASITIADTGAASGIVVPDTVIVGLPATRVFDPIAYVDAEFGVVPKLPRLMTGSSGAVSIGKRLEENDCTIVLDIIIFADK
jgi:hypothetical protein